MIALFLIASGLTDRGTWVIDGESQLVIRGATNISKFSCRMECYTGNDTLHYIKNNKSNTLQFTQNHMAIPIKSFDCGARPISRDFWNTLKSESYPQLDIRFRSITVPTIKNNQINGVVDITIAGVTSKYTIRYERIVKGNVIHLNGIHPVNFCDFNLDAPQRLSGLIQVEETLYVEFKLVLKEI